MSFSVLTRFHLGHKDHYDSWISSINKNTEHIEKVWLWCQDYESQIWIKRQLADSGIKFQDKLIHLPLDDFGPLHALSYINDSKKNIACVLDFDDKWHEHHLENANLTFLKHSELNVYAAGARFFSADGGFLYETDYVNMSVRRLLLFTPIPFSSVVWRPGSVKVDLRFNRLIDQSILYGALKENSLYCDLENFTCDIVKSRGSMSSNYYQQLSDRIKFFYITKNIFILINTIIAGGRALFLRKN